MSIPPIPRRPASGVDDQGTQATDRALLFRKIGDLLGKGDPIS